MITNAQARVAELEESKIRTVNLKRRLAHILSPSKTANANGAGVEEVSKAQIDALLKDSQSEDLTADLKGELGTSEIDHLIMRRFVVSWLTASNARLDESIQEVLDEARSREARCRKVVAMYSRVEESKLESILEDLVAAVESYSEVDMARVAGFLAKATTPASLKADRRSTEATTPTKAGADSSSSSSGPGSAARQTAA